MEQFYDGKVQNASPVLQDSYGESCPQIFKGKDAYYCFVSVFGAEEKRLTSTFNQRECETVVWLVKQLHKKSKSKDWCSIDKLRVITFYQAQELEIRMHLQRHGYKNVIVSTVDSSQGSEAETVIVSLVRGTSGHIGFLRDDRRLNVAMTRAKFQLLLVGNHESLAGLDDKRDNKSIKALALDAMSRKCVESLPASTGHATKQKERKSKTKKTP